MFLLKQPWHLYGLFFPFLLLFLCPSSPERNLDFIFFLMITGIGRTFFFLFLFSPAPHPPFFLSSSGHTHTHTHIHAHSTCVQSCAHGVCLFACTDIQFHFRLSPVSKPASLPPPTPHIQPLHVPTHVTPGQPIGVSSQMLILKPRTGLGSPCLSFQ